MNRAALFDAVQNIEALIVRNLTQVDHEVLANAHMLRVVGRLGVGLENISLDDCAARNIAVIPAAGANAQSVAEYVLGVAIVLTRGFLPATKQTLTGAWPRPRFSGYHESFGKTLGIVGIGSIGRLVAKNAQKLGLQCVAHDPMLSGTTLQLNGTAIPLLSLKDLLTQSDVVSLHLPYSPETKNLFDASMLANMKQGACLINTARGGIVDEQAVAELLRSGFLGGAALDVFETEPAKDLSHFSGLENLILTPHIAGVTFESNERVSQMIANEVNRVLEGLV